VYLASGNVSDLKFAPRTVSPSPTGEQGHPKLAASGEALHVVWDEALPGAWEEPAKAEHGHGHGHGQESLSGSGRAIHYAVSEDGETFASPRALQAKDGVFQTNPSVAVSASGAVFVTWSEASEEGRSVALVRLAIAGASCCSACCPKPKTAECCEPPARKGASE
jgi:hypothetical protein